MTMEEAASSSGGGGSGAWSWGQDKAFENALAEYHVEEEEDPAADRWELIAESVPGKTAEDVKNHFALLVKDVNSIESGLVPLPSYVSCLEEDGGKKGPGSHGDGGKGSRSEQERRKGIAWTEDEHRLFLLGLDKYGKGDWRSISRNFVISRTPTQVASHAQKYFIRLNSMNKDRRRSSIHDITSVDNNGDTAAAQGPITGQADGQAVAVPGGKPTKSSPQHPPAPPGVNVYGTTIGQPVGGPMAPAVGTPVNLPVPGGPHLAYGVRAPVASPVVTGAPMPLPPPVTYPLHYTSAHR
ncbi:uncharacterized protein M6B38_338330 [Iris pallida]|uniref:Transcription factor MYBS1 n=1 Tax=Iris pallida TaxID=29817 RepID=A0AAX6GY67_IRIPA|nr:uncharacterized protein M6B38_338330 [Iris pallida]